MTENVKVLLEHLRQNQERVIWIDAVCINQLDIVERNQQVQLMGWIYSHASSVTIWLGPEADESGLLPTFIPLLQAACDERRKEVKGIYDETINILLVEPGLERSSPAWRALGKLIERPWFSRTW